MNQQRELIAVNTKLAKRFITLTPAELDQGLAEALALLSQQIGAHRGSIFEFSATHTHISATYEWCAPGALPQKAARQQLPVTTFAWVMTQPEPESVIYLAEVAALPATASAEQEFFAQEGAKAALIVPLVLGEKTLGLLIFSLQQAGPWNTPELRAAFQAASSILAGALDRNTQTRRFHEQSERYRALVESSLDGIVIYQGDRITFINRAGLQLLGATQPTEWLGRSPLDLFHGDDHANVLELHQQVLHSGHVLPDYAARLLRQDGQIVHVEMGAGSYIDSGAQAILLILRDISERKRLEEQLSQAAKMETIGRLAGGIAHDFSNLLTALMGYNALSLEDLLPGAATYEYAWEMNKAIERAITLTQQLLAFSRRQSVQLQAFDVSIMSRQLLGMLRPLLGESVRIVTNLAVDAGMVSLAPGQFDQVLVNLAVNARDAMPQGGQLTITTRPSPDGSKVRLTVTDTGSGIDEATQSRIFEPFFTTKAPDRGTGLGLATVYNIVKQNGGEIAVSSVLGQGTTFTIEWPRLQQTRPTSSTERAGTPPALKGTGQILVVEDDELVLTFIERTLTRRGYQVFTAPTPAAALAWQRQLSGPIELIVTDLLLPELNGQALVAQMRAAQPALKALFISGYTAEVLQQHQIDELAAPLLRKPFAADDLLQAVQQALKQGTEAVRFPHP